jgi:predicted DNA-binding protein
MPRPNTFKTIGLRLSETDGEKLKTLSTKLQRPASDVVRLLIRNAVPSGLPQVVMHEAGQNGR